MTGPLAASWPSSSGRVDAVAVAAVAQLAVELVDEVAAVGEDQDAAGARGLDEAERGDGLAGAGGVLEPEALGGVGVLGLLVELDVLVELGSSCQSCGSSSSGSSLGSSSSSSSSSSVVELVVVLVVVLVDRRPVSRRRRVGGRAPRRPRATTPLAPLPLSRCRCAGPRPAARSACPDSASTWWAESTVPSARCGSSSDSSRSSPSSSENCAAPVDRGRAWRRRRARRAQRRAPGAGRAGGQGVLERSRPRRRSARA